MTLTIVFALLLIARKLWRLGMVLKRIERFLSPHRARFVQVSMKCGRHKKAIKMQNLKMNTLYESDVKFFDKEDPSTRHEAPVEGIQWGQDNTGTGVLTVSEDGRTATYLTTNPGNDRITVKADPIIGEGEGLVVGFIDITVLPDTATFVELSLHEKVS